MPCYDERNEPGYVFAEARKEFRHNSDVAQLLCATIALYEDHVKHCGYNDVMELPPEIARWWAEHQVRDKAR